MRLLVLATCLLLASCKDSTDKLLAIQPGDTEFSWPEGSDPPAPVQTTPFVTISNIAGLETSEEFAITIFFPPPDTLIDLEYGLGNATGKVEMSPPGAAEPYVTLYGQASIQLVIYAKSCFRQRIFVFDSSLTRYVERDAHGNIVGPAEGNGSQFNSEHAIDVSNVAPAPEPDPDPDPGPGPVDSIPSNLTTISGMAGIVDAAGDTKIFLTGEGGSEIVDPVTGAIEYELPTLDGLDGTAAFTAGGQAVYTVVIDAVSGAVRFESFDAATGLPRTGTSYPSEQWVLGAPSVPLVPVRLRGTIFTAPGAFGVYDAWKSEPGPVLDGEETVQPLVRVDTVGDARRVRRALRADTTGQDVLGLHFNDGEDFTYVSRLEAGPADNPANFFEATVTIPAAVDRLVPFGDAMLAWESGDTTAYLYRRDGAGDLTVPDGTVDMPADVIDAHAAVLAPGDTPRVFLLCPTEIVERSFPPGGAPTARSIGFPPGTPKEFFVAEIGGEESAAVLFEDGVRIFPLGE